MFKKIRLIYIDFDCYKRTLIVKILSNIFILVNLYILDKLKKEITSF